MYPNKRKCDDVYLDYMTSHPASRPTPKRSKSAELLAYNGEDNLRLFAFSDQDYGERSQPAHTSPNDVTMSPNDVTNQRQYHCAIRRINRSRESALDVENDETFVKACYCDSQNRQMPRYTPLIRPHKHTSPDWKSTPSLPTLYSNYTNPYCRHSNASNSRLNKLNNVDTQNVDFGHGSEQQHHQQQQDGFIQNRLVRERSTDFMMGRGNNIIDPLSRNHVTSPGIPGYAGQAQTKRGFPSIPCAHCGSQNLNNIIDSYGGGRPFFLGLQRNATTDISVETLDIGMDLAQDEDTPDSAHRLLKNNDNNEQTHANRGSNKPCHSHCCTLKSCSNMCTSYRKKFYIVLMLNLILMVMNIVGLIGIPVFITTVGPGIEDGPGAVSGAIRSQHCIDCNELNTVCDISSLGFIRMTGNQCCVKTDESLFETMMKAVDEYLDCRLKGIKDIPHVPVIQYTVQTGDNIEAENRLRWNKHADVAPKGFGNLGFKNSEIQIKKPGHYFIYTKVMYKKKTDSHAAVGYSIMKTNYKNLSWLEIDTIEEHCFTETTPKYSIHASHLVTVHKFGESEGLYVQLNNKDDFDSFSTDTKIVMFYIPLERKRNNTTQSADSIPIT